MRRAVANQQAKEAQAAPFKSIEERKKYEESQRITNDFNKLSTNDKNQIAIRIATGKATAQDMLYAMHMATFTNKFELNKGVEGKTVSVPINRIMRWEVKSDQESATKAAEMMINKTYNSRPIEAILFNGKVLLVDGHHRLLAAKNNNESNIMVKFLTPLEFTQRAQRMGRFSSPEALERIANRVEKQQDISIKK